MSEHAQVEAPGGAATPVSIYFTPCEWAFFFLVLIAGLMLRWSHLDYLPLHHDESIHAMFGQYFYDFPEIQFYKYDPEYHGPTLYMLLRPVYAMLGSSDWSARSPIALLGSLSILVPILFRRFLRPVTVLLLTAAVALSPSLVYWSRFVREDYIIFLGMFLILYGAVLAKPGARAFFILTGIAVNWATKANVFVFLGILVGYVVFEAFFNRVVLREKRTLAGSMAENISRYRIQFVAGVLSFAFVFSYLITSGYRHLEGIRDGLGLRGIQYMFLKPFHSGDADWMSRWADAMRHDVLLYWIDKHNIERIQGPFNFHLYELAWYELIFLCIFLAHLGFFYYRAGRLIKIAASVTGLIGVSAICYYLFTPGDPVSEGAFWRFFKLKDVYDLAGLFILFPHAIFVTCHHLHRREKALAFFGYYFTATLFSYSYLGEKVPWLTSYPLIAGYIYLALYFEDVWREMPLRNWREFPIRYVLIGIGTLAFILGLLFSMEDGMAKNAPFFLAGLVLPGIALADIYLPFLGTCNLRVLSLLLLFVFNARLAIMTSFPSREKELGYISQVHTTTEFRDLALLIRSNIENHVFGSRPYIHVTGEASWPVTWYFKGLPEYRFDALPADKKGYAYIFDTWKDEDQPVPEGFIARRINLRGWWVPEFPQMSLKKFLNYSINLEPWSGIGYTYVRLLTSKKILPGGAPLNTPVEGGQ